MTKKETYAYCADRTGYKPTQVRAVFMALRQYLKDNANRGNVTYLDGVASIRNYVKGAFEGLGGPWVKGRNYLLVQAIEMDPFKSLLGDIIPVNNTEGAKPVINTVLDEVTREYDVIVGTNAFSIAGAGRLQARRQEPRGRRGGSASDGVPPREVPEGHAGKGEDQGDGSHRGGRRAAISR